MFLFVLTVVVLESLKSTGQVTCLQTRIANCVLSHATETLCWCFVIVFILIIVVNAVLLQKEQDMEEDSSPQDQDEKEDSKLIIVRKRSGQSPEGMRACNWIKDVERLGVGTL